MGKRIDGFEEVCVGFLFGMAFLPFLEAYSLITGPLCAILWRLGGASGYPKAWRRIGVSISLAGALYLSTHLWQLIISAVIGILPLSFGYGIPDENDEGSTIGKFWYYYFRDEIKTNLFTRGTIGLLFGLCFYPLMNISVLWYIVSILILTIGFGLIVIKID